MFGMNGIETSIFLILASIGSLVGGWYLGALQKRLKEKSQNDSIG